MMHCRNPFPLSDRLNVRLRPAVSLWESLRRGENGMPFSDDLGVPALSSLLGSSFLLGVGESPERYRFEFLSESLHREAVLERFLDEISPNVNFSYLRAQCTATMEAAEPTLFHLTDLSGYRFSRALLPLWGNGQINLLLGAFDGVPISCP